MRRINSSNEVVLIESISIEDEKVLVYNFEVEGFNTYFISDSEIFTHNCTPPKLVDGSKGEQFERVNRYKVLKANVKYNVNGYTYITDSNRRITSVSGTLQNVNQGKRNNAAQRKVGGEDRLPDDHGGHLIAKMFGGSGNLDNLVAMNGPNVNGSGGEFYKLEKLWNDNINKGNTVSVNIEMTYNSNKNRPDSFLVNYEVNGTLFTRKIENK